MSITMPSGVNQEIFYLKAKEKGIKIRSKYLGVCLHLVYGKPKWVAKIQSGGKLIWYNDFPFNEIGEKEAAESYLSKNEEMGIDMRYNHKREYNKKKP